MKNYHQTILSKSPFGFAYHKIILDDRGNPVDYEFIEVNDAFAKLTGLSQKDLPGRTVRQVLPDIEKSAFNWIGFYGKIALEGGEKTFEQYSEPLKKWFKVHVYSPEKYFFATVFTDITTEKEQAERLTKTEKRYRGLIESQNDLIVRVDKENRFTYVNEAYCKAFGKTRDDLIGSDFFPLVHQDDRESTNKAMKQLTHPPYRCYLEQRAMTVNGWRWLAWEDNAIFDDKGEIIEIQGVGRDITAYKNQQQELKKQTASLQALLSHTTAAIYSFTISEGTPNITFLSDNITKILGYKPEDFIDNFSFWLSCLHPDDLKMHGQTFANIEKLYSPGKEVYFEYRFKDSDGNYRWLSDRQTAIINNAGNMEVIGAWVDISSQKQIQDELAGYKKRLSFAQTFAQAGSWEYDIAKGKLYWSEECEKLFGLKPGAFEGTFEAFIKRVHPDDRDYVMEVNKPITELNEGIPLRYEHRIITDQGEILWVNETAGVVNDPEGKPQFIIGMITNITKVKEAQEAIENEEKLRQIVENIDGMFWLRNADRTELLYVSPGYTEIYGESTESLIQDQQSYIKLVHPDDAKRIEKAYSRFVETGEYNEQYRIIRRDGELRWVSSKAFPVFDSNGKIVRYAGIINDITDQVMAEAERTKLVKAVTQSPVSVIITDVDGNIEYVNPKFTEVTGYSPEEVKGRQPNLLKSGNQPAEVYNELWSTIKAGKVWHGELQNRKKNGNLFWESVSISPLMNEKGEASAFIAVKEDITRQKMINEELVAAKNKAEESNRLKSAFLATMSHELRTPLNHILGFTDLVKMITQEEEVLQYATIIHNSAENFLAMIEDIFALALAEQSSTKLRPVSVSGMEMFLTNKETLAETLSRSEKGDLIKLNFKPDANILTSQIHADHMKINLVLANLFRNAVKFTEKGSIEFGFNLKSAGSITFYVQDSGVGIKDELLDMLFDLFRQGDDSSTRKHEGLGIGLAISKRIADVLDATLEVQSQQGKGATFLFTVPVEITTDPRTSGKVTLDTKHPDFNGKTILIAEDDTDALYITKRLIEPTGANLLIANNGKVALEMAASHPEINLVLMDLKMPVMDGFTATQSLKASRPELPVVALTSYALTEDKKKAMNVGFDAIVTKPIDRRLLFRELEKFLSL